MRLSLLLLLKIQNTHKKLLTKNNIAADIYDAEGLLMAGSLLKRQV